MSQTTEYSKLALFFKGMAMGTVDIVPGVSGSTVAVLLGIYERFIASLKNINGTLIKALIRPFVHRFDATSRRGAVQAIRDADLPWLLMLLAGLASAFVVASFIIPMLMERYPETMRGVFFGLVLGSIVTPIRDIQRWRFSHFLMIIACACAFYFILGQNVTAPVAIETVTTVGGETLDAICFEAPCFHVSADILAMPENQALREATAGALQPTSQTLPAGLEIALQKPLFGFCFASGFLAICAMLLPGISGSFVLLILGCYYFMLNTGKGFLTALVHGQFYGMNLVYLACFVVGALCGIAAFSRVLTWLLNRYRDMTLAAIIGILIGCLRGVWPYRSQDESGVAANIIPAIDDVWPTILAICFGLAIVIVTVWVQIRFEKKSLKDDESVDRASV